MKADQFEGLRYNLAQMKRDGKDRIVLPIETLEALLDVCQPHKSGGDSDREFELRLLAAAHCPNCDNTGTTPEGDECEWCFHRKRAVAHLKSPPKPVPSVSMDGEPFGDPHPLDACKGTSENCSERKP